MRKPRENYLNEHSMTFAEIGLRLGLRSQTVQFHYNRAMEKLTRARNSKEWKEYLATVASHRAMIDRREAPKRVFSDEPVGVGV